jgi:hypothetical protein
VKGEKEVFIMPGMEGTGPMGMGPMTGGGRGWCNPYFPRWGAPMMGYPFFRPFGWGMGFGFTGHSLPWPYGGFGRGGLPQGRGYGGYGWPTWGYAGPAPAYYPPEPWASGWGSYGAPYYPQEESRFLKDEAKMIRKELEEIEARIQELEKEKSKEEEA